MKRVPFIILIVLIISSLFIFGMKSGVKIEGLHKEYSTDDLLRLHIIANSNSFKDQRIKREVKEDIVNKTSTLFASLENPLEAKLFLESNLFTIKEVVESKLKEYNNGYNVEVEIGEFYFPKRSYGNTELNSGNYKALKVVIGEGLGNNWWCVLFPPLCFIDSTEEISDKEKKDISKEDRLVNGMEVEFRFKAVELVRENPNWVKSKLRLANILESSFPGINRLFSPNSKEPSAN
ncbi:stage II sporulation protein R [Halonatronum saccharophilum]|uniref:stage II sporulation protein R n=1 Tax=Halonatronum saccharophilum TaxID=150060 RepID=UPI00047F3830|nr:stage II sporulation protein R [Halonatronum saccharophilum]